MSEAFDLFVKQVEHLGFYRKPRKEWLIPNKNKEMLWDESPEGYYPTIIVPEHYLGKTLLLIDASWFEVFLKGLRDKIQSSASTVREKE